MLYELKNDNLEISADTHGAELHSIKFNGKEYLWQCGDAWKRYAPVLFPFISSPKDHKYMAGDKEYTMPSNHGFARDSEFKLLDNTNNMISFTLTDTEDTLKVYPYHFELIVKYSVEGNKVSVVNMVKNTGEGNMYFYLGAHPAFNCPLDDGAGFEDYYIEYSNEEHITQKVDGDTVILVEYGNKLPLTRKLFDNDAIMLDYPNSKSVSMKSDKFKSCVKVTFPDSKCIAVWSPTGDDNAKFVCLEPWTSVPIDHDDDFEYLENKPNAIKLHPNEIYTYSYQIEVD